MSAKSSRADAWFDEDTNVPLIAEQARRLDSFVSTMADGRVDLAELKAQEARLIELMKQIEPLLDDKLHAKVTELLCELTAYDFMQILHKIQDLRPRSVFRG